MRKLTGLLAFCALVLFAVQAQAVKLGIYEAGVLVPSVYHNGSTIDTVVGITCQFQDTKCDDHNASKEGTVYWTFFDVDSNHVTDGTFTCTDDDLYGFSWKANSGRGLNDTDGYLVFVAQPTKDSRGEVNGTAFNISANAFLVDQSKKDAIFIPVIPLRICDFDLNNFDPRAMNAKTLRYLHYGIQGNTTVDMRYWIDPTYNAATTIVVWLVDPQITTKGKAIPQTVLVYNDEEQSKSVNIELPHELNKIIPCNIVGMPADYVDGFIQWTFPASTDGFAYSYISSSLFGAQQTLLAAECGAKDACQQAVNRSQPSCGCTGAGGR